MLKNRLSFNVALFGVAFVICVIGAMLIFSGGRHNSTDDGMIADGGAAAPAQPSTAIPRNAVSTPLPEQANASVTPLPATPAAGLPNNLATAKPTIEADVENPSAGAPDADQATPATVEADAGSTDDVFNKAMDIYAARSAASVASRPTEDLPVTSREKPAPQSSEPHIATGNESLSADDTDRLRELPKGYIIAKETIRPVQKTDITPDSGSVEVVDISGQQQPISRERVEELLRKYRSDDLPVATNTPPPIAMPNGFRPKAFTPTPTPGVLARMRDLPKNLVTTPPPVVPGIQSNGSASPPPTDAGTAPAGALFENPTERSRRRLNDALSKAAQAPAPSENMSASTPSTAFDTAMATGMGTATPASFSVKKGKAEVSFSNVPPGWIRSETNAQVPAAAPVPGGIPTPMTNAGAAASPTPNFKTGMENGKAAASKYNLPPAPTLPPRSIEPDDKKKPQLPPAGETPDTAAPSVKPSSEAPADSQPSKLHEKLSQTQLPPEVAERLGRNPVQAASVGDKVLTRDELRKHVQAAMAGKGGKSLSEDDKIMMENVVAEEWADLTALAEEARKRGVTVTDDEVRGFMSRQEQRQGIDVEPVLKAAGFSDAEVQDRLKESALCEKLVNSAFEKDYDEAKLRAIYESSPEQFQLSRRLRVQEIFKAGQKGAAAGTEQRMQQIQRELARGQDFAKTATQESEAPTREKGGDMGWIDASSNVRPEVLKALAELRPGKVSDVIASQDGYRIVKLVDVQDPKQGFGEAQELVAKRVKKSLRDAAIDQARSDFVVKVGNRQLMSQAERTKRAASSRNSANIPASTSGFQNGRVTVRGGGQTDIVPPAQRIPAPTQEFQRAPAPKGFR